MGINISAHLTTNLPDIIKKITINRLYRNLIPVRVTSIVHLVRISTFTSMCTYTLPPFTTKDILVTMTDIVLIDLHISDPVFILEPQYMNLVWPWAFQLWEDKMPGAAL
jgi:hypothetical protein